MTGTLLSPCRDRAPHTPALSGAAAGAALGRLAQATCMDTASLEPPLRGWQRLGTDRRPPTTSSGMEPRSLWRP